MCDDGLRKDLLGVPRIQTWRIQARAEVGDPELLDPRIPRQGGGLAERHMLVSHRFLSVRVIAIVAFADQERGAGNKLRNVGRGPGIGHICNGDTGTSGAHHVIRLDGAFAQVDRFAVLQRPPGAGRNAERTRPIRQESSLAPEIDAIRKDGKRMLPGSTGALHAPRQREPVTTFQFNDLDRKRQLRGDHAKSLNNRRQANGPKDRYRLRAPRVGDRVEQAWKTRNMVRVRVRNTDGGEAAEAPPSRPPGHLRALSAVEEDEITADAHQEAGQPATWQRHHATSSKQCDVYHLLTKSRSREDVLMSSTAPVTLSLVLPLPPGVNNQYVTVGRRRALSATARQFHSNAKKAIEALRSSGAIHPEHERALGNSLLGVYLTYYFETPMKRDLDGGLKITLDVLAASLGFDDRSIVDLHLTKRIDPLRPRVEIDIETIAEWEFDQTYHYLGDADPPQ